MWRLIKVELYIALRNKPWTLSRLTSSHVADNGDAGKRCVSPNSMDHESWDGCWCFWHERWWWCQEVSCKEKTLYVFLNGAGEWGRSTEHILDNATPLLLSWSTTPLFIVIVIIVHIILDNDAMLSWWITPLFTVKININVHNIYWWQVIVDRWVLFQSIVQYMLFSSLTLIVILTSHLCHPFSWSLSFLMFLFWPIRARLVFSQMFLFCAGFALIRKKLGDYSFLSPKHSSDKKGLTDI